MPGWEQVVQCCGKGAMIFRITDMPEHQPVVHKIERIARSTCIGGTSGTVAILQ